MIKIPVKFQKDRYKTVGGVVLTRFPLQTQNHAKKSKLTSKFHREFMSPALFLFELLKMGKLTRGPLVLYHLPKY